MVIAAVVVMILAKDVKRKQNVPNKTELEPQPSKA